MYLMCSDLPLKVLLELSWIGELPLFRIIVQLVPMLKVLLHRSIYIKLKTDSWYVLPIYWLELSWIGIYN